MLIQNLWVYVGNYSWGSEAVTRKTRISDVVYKALNNELVQIQTLVKSAIVQVDVKQCYLQHYGVDIGRKKKAAAKKDSVEADILLRGYFGWNSRLALHVLDKVFPKGEIH
ncbi:hypothetical protein K1719_032749 [Acacia pycnantha]|nr:hypothetical protein K1719_032749 [Acacia pycnantha]